MAYRHTNWTDGQKISKDDFINEVNATVYQQSFCIGSLLNVYNYGLLPGVGNSRAELFVFVDNQQQVQVRLQNFRGITLSGHTIDIDETGDLNNNPLKANIPGLSFPFQDLKGTSTAYFIVLVIHPYERVPYGMADPDETPLRHPYVIPYYSLQLMPEDKTCRNVIGEYHLPIGRLKIEEQKVVVDEEYVPPCCVVSSHEHLRNLHAAIEKFLGQMQLYSLHIIQKILQKKQQNDLAAIVKQVCEQICRFTTEHISSFKLIKLYQPPIFLMDTICTFASLLKNTLDIYTGSGKEEFINYCTEEWCNMSQGQLESAITLLSNHEYNHLDIHDSILKVSRFTETFNNLFAKLASLEYVGIRKPGIFVSSRVVSDSVVKEQIFSTESNTNHKKSSRFLLD